MSFLLRVDVWWVVGLMTAWTVISIGIGTFIGMCIGAPDEPFDIGDVDK